MWDGACPQWQCLSQHISDWASAIGGKPPPTLDLLQYWGGVYLERKRIPSSSPRKVSGYI